MQAGLCQSMDLGKIPQWDQHHLRTTETTWAVPLEHVPHQGPGMTLCGCPPSLSTKVVKRLGAVSLSPTFPKIHNEGKLETVVSFIHLFLDLVHPNQQSTWSWILLNYVNIKMLFSSIPWHWGENILINHESVTVCLPVCDKGNGKERGVLVQWEGNASSANATDP